MLTVMNVAGKKWFLQPSVNTKAGEATSKTIKYCKTVYQRGAMLAEASISDIVDAQVHRSSTANQRRTRNTHVKLWLPGEAGKLQLCLPHNLLAVESLHLPCPVCLAFVLRMHRLINMRLASLSR